MKNILTKFLTFIILPLIMSGVFMSFFIAGALADRIFYIKPLDLIYKNNQNQEKNITRDTYNGPEDVANIAENVSKSVITVSISKTQIFRQRSLLDELFGINPFFQRENLPQENVSQDIGSGFVVENSLVITNKHVVGDTTAKYKVIDNEDKEYEVVDIYRDPSNDLAILKVKDLNLTGLPLGDSDKLRVGQRVIAIGTALGEFRHTVTTGVVSGLSRGIVAESSFGMSEELENVIQTDAAINPGNSGGPLIDMAGKVIGINVAVSRGAENVGFALPINALKSSLENFNTSGQFDRPYLGVRYQMVSKKAALANEVPSGAYISEVLQGSPAEKANIKVGDIVTEFDGVAINPDNNSELATLVNKKKVGDTVKIKLFRWDEDKNLEINVTLEKLQN